MVEICVVVREKLVDKSSLVFFLKMVGKSKVDLFPSYKDLNVLAHE